MTSEVVFKDVVTNLNYSVTNDGRVWSKRRNKFLKPLVDKDGYYRVNLGDKQRDVGIHQIVFEAFYRRLLPNEVVHHLSQVKTQNEPTNLVAWDRGRHCREHSTGNKYNLGRKCSDETKEKLRLSNTGRPQSLQTRMKRSESLKGLKRGPMSQQHKQKLKQAWVRRKERCQNLKS